MGHREAVEVLGEFFDEFEGAKSLKRRARELLKRLAVKTQPISCAPVSPIRRRRNGFELSRENLQLADITNQWSAGPRSGVRGSVARRDEMSRDASMTTPVPAPLFSPRKRPSAKDLQQQQQGGSGSPMKRDSAVKKKESGGGADIGSPRFYEDEVDEASRIWRAMRNSSAGSGVLYAQTGEEEGGEFAEREDGDENKSRAVLGAPWL